MKKFNILILCILNVILCTLIITKSVTAQTNIKTTIYNNQQKEINAPISEKTSSINIYKITTISMSVIILLFIVWTIKLLRQVKKTKHNRYIIQEQYNNFIKHTSDGVSCWKLPKVNKTNLPIEQQLDNIYNAKCISLNEKAWMAYGAKSKGEILNKKYKDIHLEHNLDEFLTEFIKNNYKLDNYELKEELISGKTLYTLTSMFGFIKKDQLIYIWLTSNDISYHKNIENKLRAAKEKAEESDNLKTAFLANISHEIHTPLNGILGFTELLQDPSLSNEEQQEYILSIKQSSERMRQIVKDLIDISKIETKQMTLIKKESSINTILNEAYRLFNLEAMNKNIEFTLDTPLDEAQSIMNIDPDKIMQVINSLLSNAFKFTTKGKISFGYKQKDNLLEFYVSDTGIGINPDMSNIIFERFRQVDIHDAGNYQGAGLGLFISKFFIEMHNGKMWVDSEIDKGSTFYFTLPHQNSIKNHKKIQPGNNASLTEPIKKYKVLIAEDDDINYKLLVHILKAYNISCIHAFNGLEAIKMTEEDQHIDLILMDIKMPLMNGLEATRQIKEKHPSMPIIAQSAFNSDTDIQNALNSGCDDFVPKPINKKTMYTAISKFLL